MKKLIALSCIALLCANIGKAQSTLNQNLSKFITQTSWTPETQGVTEIKFMQDGQYRVYVDTGTKHADSCVATWSLNGNVINIKIKNQVLISAVVYSVSPKELNLKFEDGKVICYKPFKYVQH